MSLRPNRGDAQELVVDRNVASPSLALGEVGTGGAPSGPASGRPVIEAHGLRKSFGRTHALDGLDLVVEQGEVRGFLGPNGAGKSTTIRALLGQLRLNAGTARIYGLDCWKEAPAVHRRLAYVPGNVFLWPSLTGGECIDVLGRMQGSASPQRRRDLVDRFDLDTSKRSRTYSKGNRQKVALVAALSTDAELLIFDEPTSGLDPLMEEVFQQCVREVKAEGRTVLLSSHILAEVEALCDRVSILRKGALVSEGSLDELRAHTQTRVTAVTAGPIGGLVGLRGVNDLETERRPEGLRTTFRAEREQIPASVAVVVAAQPSSLTVEPPGLDELFLDRYREEDERELATTARQASR
jgi:ABC-2 type transport system ATP-binding protein